jgi:hypothetical protein
MTSVSYEIPCPKLIMDYHRHVGGTDTHVSFGCSATQCNSRLSLTELQDVSIGRAMLVPVLELMGFYLPRLFLGLLDLALTNAYIVHSICFQVLRSSSHADFLTPLHARLLAVTPADEVEVVEITREDQSDQHDGSHFVYSLY